jgi:hypothetical protein
MTQTTQEHLQSALLSETIRPRMQQLYPDDNYVIGGRGCAIAWKPSDTASDTYRAIAPTWFIVPGATPATLVSARQRVYLMWAQHISPLLVLELATGDGTAEYDPTPGSGEYWLYEQVIQAHYYAIYDIGQTHLEIYQQGDRQYQQLVPNAHGRYHIAGLDVELGIWQGFYGNIKLPWLRWWDMQGELLPTPAERAEEERRLVEQEQWRTERLAALLRSLSSDTDREE